LSELEKLKAQINAVYEGLSLILSRWNEIEESWGQAPAQVKAEAEVDPKEIAEATWTKYTKGSGEWAFSDKLPKLREALLKADKRLEFEGHTYRLQGAENKFVARYPKKKGG